MAAGIGNVHTQVLPENSQKVHFDRMCNYLTLKSGKWTGENERFNPDDQNSPKAFGLWFERPLENLLTLKVVAYMLDTTIISSQGIFSWHPIEKQFIHITADRGNGYSEGISIFPSDTSFTSIMKVYRPNGNSYDHKDENFIISQDVHRNTSFKKDSLGNWIANGSWIWNRDLNEGQRK